MPRGASSGPRGRGRGRGARTATSQCRPESAAGANSDAAAQQSAAVASSSAGPTSTPIEISPSTTPSTTPTPNPATRSRPVSTRGTTRPAGPPLTGRLRPRNVRRNEEQREQLAQQEAKKDSERAAEERRLRGRTRFRGRRGRGNQFGPRMSNVGPSGLFQNENGGELAVFLSWCLLMRHSSVVVAQTNTPPSQSQALQGVALAAAEASKETPLHNAIPTRSTKTKRRGRCASTPISSARARPLPKKILKRSAPLWPSARSQARNLWVLRGEKRGSARWW